MEISTVDDLVQSEIEKIVLSIFNKNANENGIVKSDNFEQLIDNLRASSFFKIDKTDKEKFIKLSHLFLPIA
jgi:hypothetical protein